MLVRRFKASKIRQEETPQVRQGRSLGTEALRERAQSALVPGRGVYLVFGGALLALTGEEIRIS